VIGQPITILTSRSMYRPRVIRVDQAERPDTILMFPKRRQSSKKAGKTAHALLIESARGCVGELETHCSVSDLLRFCLLILSKPTIKPSYNPPQTLLFDPALVRFAHIAPQRKAVLDSRKKLQMARFPSFAQDVQRTSPRLCVECMINLRA
jgi:hypothetical protein